MRSSLVLVGLSWAAGAPTKPRLAATAEAQRSPLVALVPDSDTLPPSASSTSLTACDPTKLRGEEVQGLPFKRLECINGELLVDGIAVAATQLEDGVLAFIDHQHDLDVVLYQQPAAGQLGLGYAAPRRVGTASSELMPFTTTLYTDIYDIYTETGEYWYELRRQFSVGDIGLRTEVELFTQDGFDMREVVSFKHRARAVGYYNISFNLNWPASGNGEYIHAELWLTSSVWAENDRIAGFAYIYDNVTCFESVCEANATRGVNWRGDKVQLSGEVRPWRRRLAVAPSKAPELKPEQLAELEGLLVRGRADVEARSRGEMPVNYDKGSTCDAESALALIRGMVDPSPANTFNDFWGTVCGTESNDNRPEWQQTAQSMMHKVMLWFQAKNEESVCLESNSPDCAFCVADEQCYSSPDGSPSPASEETVFGMWQQSGYREIPECSTCTTTACRNDCLPQSVFDMVTTGPNRTVVQEYLRNMSYASLSQMYSRVEGAGNGPNGDGQYEDFGDWMYDTWGDEAAHREHEEKLYAFFNLGVSNMEGYQVLGLEMTRVALRNALSRYMRLPGSIPPALQDNACLASSSGESGILLFDSADTESFGTALFEWATNETRGYSNARQILQYCYYQDRVNYMLDLFAPDKPEYVQELGNIVSSLEMEEYSSFIRFDSDEVLSDYLLRYMTTHFSWVDECSRDVTDQRAACEEYRQMNKNVTDYMEQEYRDILEAYNIQYFSNAALDAQLRAKLAPNIQSFSRSALLSTNALANWERIATDIFCPSFNSAGGAECSKLSKTFPHIARGMMSAVRIFTYSMFVANSVPFFSADGWASMSTFDKVSFVSMAVFFSWELIADLRNLGVFRGLRVAASYASKGIEAIRATTRSMFDVNGATVRYLRQGAGMFFDVMMPSPFGSISRRFVGREFGLTRSAATGQVQQLAPLLRSADDAARGQAQLVLRSSADDMTRTMGAVFADTFTKIRTGVLSGLEQIDSFFRWIANGINDYTFKWIASLTKETLENSKYAAVRNLKFVGPNPLAFFGESVGFAFNVYAAHQAGKNLAQDRRKCRQEGYQQTNDCDTLAILNGFELSFNVAGAVTSAVMMGAYLLGLSVGVALPMLGVFFAIGGAIFAITLGFLRNPPAPPDPPTPTSIVMATNILRPYVELALPSPVEYPGWYDNLVEEALNSFETTGKYAPPLPLAPPPVPSRPPPSPSAPWPPFPTPLPPLPPFAPIPPAAPPLCPGVDWMSCLMAAGCMETFDPDCYSLCLACYPPA